MRAELGKEYELEGSTAIGLNRVMTKRTAVRRLRNQADEMTGLNPVRQGQFAGGDETTHEIQINRDEDFFTG